MEETRGAGGPCTGGQRSHLPSGNRGFSQRELTPEFGPAESFGIESPTCQYPWRPVQAKLTACGVGWSPQSFLGRLTAGVDSYQGSYMLNVADCPMEGQQLMMPKAQTLTDDSLGQVTEDLLQVSSPTPFFSTIQVLSSDTPSRGRTESSPAR